MIKLLNLVVICCCFSLVLKMISLVTLIGVLIIFLKTPHPCVYHEVLISLT